MCWGWSRMPLRARLETCQCCLRAVTPSLISRATPSYLSTSSTQPLRKPDRRPLTRKSLPFPPRSSSTPTSARAERHEGDRCNSKTSTYRSRRCLNPSEPQGICQKLSRVSSLSARRSRLGCPKSTASRKSTSQISHNQSTTLGASA